MISRRRWIALPCATTVLVLAVSAAYAGGEVANKAGGIFVSQSYNDQKQVYVSDVFTLHGEMDIIHTAYSRFLLEKYHVKDPVSCGGAVLGKMDEAQARTYQKQQWAKNRTLGFKITETGWKYSGAVLHFPFLCSSSAERWTNGRSKNVFLRATDVVDAPTSAEAELYNAWVARVKETNPDVRVAESGCVRMTPEDDAARKKRLLYVDQEKGGPNWEVVHVPFSFTATGKAAEAQRDGGH